LSDRKPYIGYALQAIDAKGRVAIPSDLRGQLESNGADKRVYVDFHRDDACLIGFDTGWLTTLREKLVKDEDFKRSRDADYDLDLDLRASVVSAEAVAFDASGRFIMPTFLRETGGFGDWAFFSGTIDNFEIWNPADLMSNPRAPDRAKRVLAWSMKQKGLV
jgi:MraZ protein